MERRLKQSATASFLLHLAVLLLLLLYVPSPNLPPPGDPDTVQMEFTGSHAGPRTNKSAAKTKAEKREAEHEAAAAKGSETASHHAARQIPTPPRPPVTPPPQPTQPPTPKVVRPIPTPPDVPKPPPPTAQPAVPLPPPPPPVRHPPREKPKTPPTPPKPPEKVVKHERTPPKQETKPAEKPVEKPVQKQAQKQTQKADDNSSDLSDTLNALRSEHTHGKKNGKNGATGSMDNALAALRAGGAPEAGGNPNATNDNGGLSKGQRDGIADGVRRCWDYDSGAKDADTFSVQLRVITDGQGTVHIAQIAPSENGHMNADPAFRAFAERARRAVLDPRCSSLALPSSMLGRNRTIDFRFRP